MGVLSSQDRSLSPESKRKPLVWSQSHNTGVSAYQWPGASPIQSLGSGSRGRICEQGWVVPAEQIGGYRVGDDPLLYTHNWFFTFKSMVLFLLILWVLFWSVLEVLPAGWNVLKSLCFPLINWLSPQLWIICDIPKHMLMKTLPGMNLQSPTVQGPTSRSVLFLCDVHTPGYGCTSPLGPSNWTVTWPKVSHLSRLCFERQIQALCVYNIPLCLSCENTLRWGSAPGRESW